MSALKGVINQAYENDFKTQVSNNDISLTQVKHENGEFNETTRKSYGFWIEFS